MATVGIPSIAGVQIIRESTRRIIAYGALAGFFGILVLIVVGGWLVLKASVDDVLKVLTATASVLGGVVGAIIGFYFQAKE